MINAAFYFNCETDVANPVEDMKSTLLTMFVYCRHRSKSIISEDFVFSSRETDRNYPLRRQSAISDFKPKVSDTIDSFDILYNISLKSRYRSGQKLKQLLNGKKRMLYLWKSQRVLIQCFHRTVALNLRGIFHIILAMFLVLTNLYSKDIFVFQQSHMVAVPVILCSAHHQVGWELHQKSRALLAQQMKMKTRKVGLLEYHLLRQKNFSTNFRPDGLFKTSNEFNDSIFNLFTFKFSFFLTRRRKVAGCC